MGRGCATQMNKEKSVIKIPRDKTPLERLCSLEDSSSGCLTNQDLIDFIGTEDSHAPALKSATEQDNDLYLEVVEYFLDQYGDNRELLDIIYEHWPNGPRIFQFAQAAERKRTLESLSEKQIRRAEALTDYIFRIRADRYLSIHNGDDTDQYFFSRFIPRRQLAEAKESLFDIILSLFEEETACFILRCKYHNMARDVLFGFYFQDGDVSKIPAGQLRNCFDPMPDSHEYPKQDDYQVAFVNLD